MKLFLFLLLLFLFDCDIIEFVNITTAVYMGVCDMDIKKVIENLEKNNMTAYCVKTKADVVPLIETLIKPGETVALGGSMSLFECGVIDFLRNGKYNFIDRYKDGIDVRQVYLDSFGADTYFCSCNAVTEDGLLYNVDGNSNRVAAICYGPKSVIMVVGINKIVKDTNEAILRVKNTAAPKNAQRLSCKTYCAEKGHCVSEESSFGGCAGKDRICANYVISGRQRVPGRIKIIFVEESVGY